MPDVEKHSPAPEADDRWGFRAKRQEFLARFGAPGIEEALSDLTDALLREARYHATWPVATAEKWRYDRMLWTFGVMLGEIPADTPAPAAPCPFCGGDHDDPVCPASRRQDRIADDGERSR